MSNLPRIKLHGGNPTADELELPVPRLAQGIVVYGTLYTPPDEPAPYYPDWYATEATFLP